MQTTHTRSNRLLKVIVPLVLVAALGWPIAYISPAVRAYSDKAISSVKSAIGLSGPAGSPIGSKTKARAGALAQQQKGKTVNDKEPTEAEPNADVSVISYDGTIPKNRPPSTRLAATATAAVVGEVEPNGTSATASPIAGTGARIKGNLFPNGDIDFYSFTATAGDRVYSAMMTSGSAGNSTDSQLRVLASDGTTEIEFDDDNGSFAGLSSTIAGATIPTTGTYYLRVNDFTAGTASERSYELWFQLQSGTPTPEVESNDTPATANSLPANGWVSGTRNPASATEQDWYSLSLNAGDTVFLSLDLDPERDSVTWTGRLGFALFGDAGNQILVVDDAGTGDVSPHPNLPSEALFMTVKTAGTYYAFVDSASAAVGGPTATYHLSVSVLPAPTGLSCTTYTSTDVPKTIGPGTGLVSSTITVPGNPRIEDLNVEIVLNHTVMNQIDAHLRSPAGNNNGLFTDIGAAAIGGQTQMDLLLDDEAGVPIIGLILKGLQFKPENNSTAGTANTSGAYRLSSFYGEDAGGTWTLDLYDDVADANGGTLTSWSIRVCTPPPAPSCPMGFTPVTVFSTDFESGAEGFTHSGTSDQWELGLPNTAATTTANPVAAFTTCNSGVNCWKTNLNGTYSASSNQDLLSPNINLAGYVGPVVVTWAMRHQIETANFDHMFVDAQQVGGATPMRLYEWIEPTPISASAGTGNPQQNIGGSYGWGVYSRRADSLAGLNTELRFHLDSDTTVQFGGLAIDDVTVTACAPSSADLSITKTDGVTTATPGGSVTYTITASNAGPTAVTGATVEDTFPAVLTCTWTCVGAGGGTCTAAGSGNINDTTVNLPVGGSVTYTASCAIAAAATGTLSNTATVSSSVTDPDPANNSATDTDTLTPMADLAITKTNGVTQVTAGGSTTYTIVASNSGPSNASGATIADTFPASLTCTWTCVGAGGGSCTAAGAGNISDTVNLPVGGSVTYTASCAISGGATGTLSNTAMVAAPGGVTDPVPGDNSATDTDTIGASADLAITKTDGVTTVTAGGSTTYTITASNAGPSNAPGATVADTFPATLTCTWTCVGAGGGTCTAAGAGNISDTVNLPAGGSVTYTASCAISGGATGTLSNMATVAAPGGVTDPNPANNSATDTDTVLSQPDLAITKTDGTGTATAGSTVTYTIVASNPAGSLGVTGATVTDNFPAGFNGVNWTCVGAGGGSCPAGGSGNINALVNLPAGSSVTFTATGTVTGNAPGTLVNTATVATPGGVTDSNPANNSATDTDAIVCPTITLSPASLPNATINTAYPTTISASPAGGNYTFSVTSGLLPTGLTLNANGSFSGAPTQSGVFNFRITASGFGGCTAFRDYVLVVNCETITVNPSSLPGGSIGTAYNQSISASPAGTYSYAVSSGALPNGLTLNASTGGITGTPTNAGTFALTITASQGGCSGSQSYSITITCPTLTLGALPSGQAGVAYSATITVSPAGSYTFSLAAGNLPSGLTLNPATGQVSGIPTTTGTVTFTVKAESATSCSATQSYTLVISCPTVTVTPASLPAGTAGTAYSQTISAAPAGGNYVYSASGTLPPGLNLNPATGVLSGTPSANGSSTFTVTATGFGGCTGSQSYTLVIGSGGCPTVTLPASLPNGSVGQLYNAATVASPAGIYNYSATGSLPPGVTLYANTGLLFGYPTAMGSYSFTVTATQGACSGSQSYTVQIGAGFASLLTVFSDFDGDGKSDLSVFRGGTGNWLVANSGDGQLQSTTWGAAGEPHKDVTVSGDYDGDGKTDQAVFRRGGEYAGYWFIKRSSDGGVSSHFWGLPTDVPVPGDYDADGRTDVAVWRASAGAWYVLRSSDGGMQGVLWGDGATDVPVPGDYDGDGKTDAAVFRKSDGHWYIKRSSDGKTLSQEWGVGTDVPVPGDYDGDGQTDFAVWRASDGNWHILESGSGAQRTVALGANGDVPVAADYDGDGKADPAVWQASSGNWRIKRSSDNVEMSKIHGQSNDTPVMARKN